MAYGIVKRSGGNIRVESRPGAGSSFKIDLPRVDAAEPVRATPVSTGPLPGGSETILLAEDESGVPELIGSYLGGLGYRVLTASNGLTGVAVARSHPEAIHLLLSDFVMPKMGGRELATERRRITPQMKVIILSGYAGHTVSANDLELGDARFLAKPLSLEVLAKTVRELLDANISALPNRSQA